MLSLAERIKQLYLSGQLDSSLADCKPSLFLKQLYEFGRSDLSLARLVEAHCDGVFISKEAGLEIRPGIYGVWASESGGEKLQLLDSQKGPVLFGKKRYCSGSEIATNALVTAWYNGQRVLVSLSLDSQWISRNSSPWQSHAFEETGTATVNFDHCPVEKSNIVYEPDWYIRRDGFWLGALAPAACWAGGARKILDYLSSWKKWDSHNDADLGKIDSAVWLLESLIASVGPIGNESMTSKKFLYHQAIRFRSIVESSCKEILAAFRRIVGPGPFAFDAAISKHCDELQLYIAQFHGLRDLEGLGHSLRGV